MSDYRPILYHQALSYPCAKVRRKLRQLRVDVQLKDILISRRNRGELQELLEGRKLQVPCLVLSDTVIADERAIIRYLRLRYGSVARQFL